ncbi:unnamed protein product [Symbiodinium microadriaticum]|nr:unnamed protein product [Symbiodinium microadriaticum]
MTDCLTVVESESISLCVCQTVFVVIARYPAPDPLAHKVLSATPATLHLGEACTVRRLYTDWVYYDEVVETRLPVPASMPENLTANSTSPNHDISFASLDVAWDAHPPGECIFTGWKVETRIHDRNLDWEESSECRANPREPFECQITQGLLSNVYYDMRITETCVDPNALGDTLTVLDIARTRPVPAVAPFIVSVYATSARSLGVRISQRAAGQCVFEAYTMEWKMQGWDYWLPYDDCTPRSTTTCSVSGFPASQSYYTVRMKESCTDPMADSPWVEWPDFVLTWPEPAQIPSNFTAVELTAYNMTFTFEPGLGLDCTWSSWEVQILQGDAGPLATEWMDLTECYLPFRENVTCSVTNLQSFTVYQVRVRERCTDFIYDSDWGYSDPIMTTMPVQAGVPVDMRIVPNSITAFFFDVSWQAGASGQCIFKEWVGRPVLQAGCDSLRQRACSVGSEQISGAAYLSYLWGPRDSWPFRLHELSCCGRQQGPLFCSVPTCSKRHRYPIEGSKLCLRTFVGPVTLKQSLTLNPKP